MAPGRLPCLHYVYPPELFKRKPNVPQPVITEKVDIYSFGIILWEVTHAGQVLYDGLTTPEIKKMVQDGLIFENVRVNLLQESVLSFHKL